MAFCHDASLEPGEPGLTCVCCGENSRECICVFVSLFVCYLPQASQLGVLTELGHTWPEVSKYVTHRS